MDSESGSPQRRIAALIADARRGRAADPADELARQQERIEALCIETFRTGEDGEGPAGKVVDEIEQAVRALNAAARAAAASNASGEALKEQRWAAGEMVRRTAVGLQREFWWLDLPARINDVLMAEFPDIEDLVRELGRDREGIEEIRKEERQWEEATDRLLPYGADLGIPFPGRVEISRAGLRWRHSYLPLEQITRLSWGSRSHRVGGFPIGRVWTISVGDRQHYHVIKAGDHEVHAAVVDRLWRTVGKRLYTDLLLRMRRDYVLCLPGLNVHDEGVELSRPRWFGGSKAVQVPWDDVEIKSTDEELLIRSKRDKKAHVALSYERHDNVTILENMIRKFFDSGKSRPSELLD